MHLQLAILFLALHGSRAFLLGGGAVFAQSPSAAATRRWADTYLPLLPRGGTRMSRPNAASSAVMMASSASDFEIGFSFSVAGLLFPYHLGVASALREEGLLVDGSPLAGACAKSESDSLLPWSGLGAAQLSHSSFAMLALNSFLLAALMTLVFLQTLSHSPPLFQSQISPFSILLLHLSFSAFFPFLLSHRICRGFGWRNRSSPRRT